MVRSSAGELADLISVRRQMLLVTVNCCKVRYFNSDSQLSPRHLHLFEAASPGQRLNGDVRTCSLQIKSFMKCEGRTVFPFSLDFPFSELFCTAKSKSKSKFKSKSKSHCQVQISNLNFKDALHTGSVSSLMPQAAQFPPHTFHDYSANLNPTRTRVDLNLMFATVSKFKFKFNVYDRQQISI